MFISSSTTGNFCLNKNLIILDCEINGSIQSFIFDSGAPCVVLNKKYVEKDLLDYLENTLQGATGEIANVNQNTIENLSYGGIRKSNIDALTMDLSHLEIKIKQPIYGLIGYDFFKGLDVYINYQECKLGLWSHSKVEEYVSDKAYKRYDFEMEKHLPIIECKIGDKVYNFALDTGANTNLIDLKLQDKLQEDIEIIHDSQSLTGANRDTKESAHSIYNLKSLEVGNLGIYSYMNVVFSDIDHLNQKSEISINGILGYEFLSKNEVIMSYSNRKLYILVN